MRATTHLKALYLTVRVIQKYLLGRYCDVIGESFFHKIINNLQREREVNRQVPCREWIR